jgi:hypothetical protein
MNDNTEEALAEIYARSRAEVEAMLGVGADAGAVASTQVDLVAALKFLFDHLQAKALAGERIDINQLLLVSTALSKYLPAIKPREPISHPREEPRRQLADLLERMAWDAPEDPVIEQMLTIADLRGQLSRMNEEIRQLRAATEAPGRSAKRRRKHVDDDPPDEPESPPPPESKQGAESPAAKANGPPAQTQAPAPPLNQVPQARSGAETKMLREKVNARARPPSLVAG